MYRHYKKYIIYLLRVLTVCSWMAELQKISNEASCSETSVRVSH